MSNQITALVMVLAGHCLKGIGPIGEPSESLLSRWVLTEKRLQMNSYYCAVPYWCSRGLLDELVELVRLACRVELQGWWKVWAIGIPDLRHLWNDAFAGNPAGRNVGALLMRIAVVH